MNTFVSHFRILAFILAAISAPAAAQTSSVLVFTNANVIDGVSPQPLLGATVVVRDGKIASVAAGRGEVPPGAQVTDLKGMWLLPGFIDAHVHTSDLRAFRAALASGATTVRALGVDHFVDVGVRELNHRGVADLPDVLAAGYHVRPRPSESMFTDLPALADLLGTGVNGPENVRRMVAALIARGASAIKIMATERAGLPDTDPRKRVYSEEELAAAVDEARKSGVLVAAHAHGDEGARAAVRAGVRTIEHGTYLSEETLALMKQKGTCLVPTVATVLDLIDPGGDYDNSILSIRGRSMLPLSRAVTARARQLGIPVIAGTDTGYGPNSRRRVPDEIAQFIEIGFPPMEAIQSATSAAARCLGIAERTGAVRAGLEADLIVVQRNPLEDSATLLDVLLVVNNGRVAINRLSR